MVVEVFGAEPKSQESTTVGGQDEGDEISVLTRDDLEEFDKQLKDI